MTDGSNKSGRLRKQIQWNRWTKSMESLNETNGIVQQFQWICFRKPSDKVVLSGRKNAENRQCCHVVLLSPLWKATLYTHLYRQYNRQRMQRFQCLAEKTAWQASSNQPRAAPWVSYYRQWAPCRGKRIDHLHLGKRFCPCRALVTHDHSTQGVALGWLLLAFQADYFRCV